MNLTGALMPDPTKGKDRFTLAADLTIAPSAAAKPDRRRAAGPEREP